MKKADIIQKIEKAGLVGRGGASYPVAKKWAAVLSALEDNKTGYIVINGAEGEPDVKKDGYLLAHYPEDIIKGVAAAEKFLGQSRIKKIYCFLSHDYFKKYSPALKKILSDKYQALDGKWEFVIKPEFLSYIAGEETALLNLIEGKKIQPRLKPPYPTASGLYGCPTLVNNTETFYNVSRVMDDLYVNDRFYTIAGAVKHEGVYRLPADLTIADIFHQTGNFPNSSFFVQIGGGASGEVLRSDQINRRVDGAGLIKVYDKKRTSQDKLIKYWLKFYHDQSCGQCSSCREGTYHLWELAVRKKKDDELFWEIVGAMQETSFCGLGLSLPVPLKSYFNNIVKQQLYGKREEG